MTAEQVIDYFISEQRRLSDNALDLHAKGNTELAEMYRQWSIELSRIIAGARTVLETKQPEMAGR